jgi:hypothetical protein
MYYDEHSEEYIELSYQLLKRFTGLGCTLNESIQLATRALQGETITIRTDGHIQDNTVDIIMDYLFDPGEYFDPIDDEFDDEFKF